MLVNYNQIEQEREKFKSATHANRAKHFINEVVDTEIGYQLGEIKPNTVIHVGNENRWSLHDLVVHCIKSIGPCRLYFCTYAIKEYQARLLTNMLSEGLITEMHALVDYRFAQMDAKAEQLLSKACTTYRWEQRLHGKVTVLNSESISVSIIGSANFTTNTSRDTIVIDTSKEAAEFWTNWITQKIKQ